MKTTLLPILLFMLLHLNITAQITFQKTFGDTIGNAGFSIQQTADGGYVISGHTKGFSTGDSYLIKTDNNGDTLWTRIFGGPSDDNMYSVKQTIDSGYVMTGLTNSFGAGNGDIYFIKTKKNGDTVWTKTFGTANGDRGAVVQQTADSGYIVSGVTSSIVSSWDFYLVKTTVNGDTLWTKKYGGANADVNYSAQQTTDGGYFLAGSTYSFGAGNGDVYLVKTNSNGDTLWTKTYGGPVDDDECYAAQQTADGGYILAGLTYCFGAGNGDVYLIKTNSNGDTLWTKTFGGANIDYANSIRETSDGGFIIAGYSESFGGGNGDAYLIRTDANGNLIWSNTYGTTSTDEGYDVVQTIDGGYAVSGYAGGFGTGNVYLIKTDANGNSGGCNEYAANTTVGTTSSVVIVPSGFVYSGGIVNSTNSIVGSGGSDVTVLCTTLGKNEINNLISISVYPNPFISSAAIQLNSEMHNGEISIFNIYGQQIKKINDISGDKIKIDRDNLPNGLYFIRLMQDKKIVATEKIFITD